MKGIFCAGEQGRTVLDILRRAGDAEDVIFFDDDEEIHGSTVAGKQVGGGMESVSEFNADDIRFVVAFGDRQGIRLELADAIAERGFDFYSIVDPDATVSSAASVGYGSIINAQSYVGPDALLEEHVIVDSAVNVSHDSVLERGATITPNATLAGGTHVGVDAYIGPGATVLEDVTVGEGAVVGAGAVVNQDVAPSTTVVGVPAEPL